MDAYYQRTEVSNSDLSWLKNQLFPRPMPDPTNSYKFGSLLDAMITEPDRIDYFKHTLDGEVFSPEDFHKAEEMKKAFWDDEFCRIMAEKADGQKKMFERLDMNFNGYEFHLNTRCKWDLWRQDWKWGGDIKTTAAETQKQFEDACRYFDYDRQRAWYMDIAGCERDVLIGISKKNFRVFKIPINRDSSFYKDGKSKYLELSFRWYMMFGESKNFKTY
ncbi:MAG: hypothetical protein BGO29_14940 [Bacteroidales bacterium 36-12]|nr:MAG: hypothetical protein BGO29_14940 [Bacteroidales bacterium 36-12]